MRILKIFYLEMETKYDKTYPAKKMKEELERKRKAMLEEALRKEYGNDFSEEMKSYYEMGKNIL